MVITDNISGVFFFQMRMNIKMPYMIFAQVTFNITRKWPPYQPTSNINIMTI